MPGAKVSAAVEEDEDACNNALPVPQGGAENVITVGILEDAPPNEALRERWAELYAHYGVFSSDRHKRIVAEAFSDGFPCIVSMVVEEMSDNPSDALLRWKQGTLTVDITAPGFMNTWKEKRHPESLAKSNNKTDASAAHDEVVNKDDAAQSLDMDMDIQISRTDVEMLVGLLYAIGDLRESKAIELLVAMLQANAEVTRNRMNLTYSVVGRFLATMGTPVRRMYLEDYLLLVSLMLTVNPSLLTLETMQLLIKQHNTSITGRTKRMALMLISGTLAMGAEFFFLFYVGGSSNSTITRHFGGTVYWKPCNGSTAVSGAAYASFSEADDDRKDRFLGPTVAVLSALETALPARWFSQNFTVCSDFLSAVYGSASSLAAVDSSNCSQTLMTALSSVVFHRGASAYRWLRDSGFVTLVMEDTMLAKANQDYRLPFTVLSEDVSTSLWLYNQSTTVYSFYGFPTDVCIANTLKISSTSCVLYGDDTAYATPYLFVGLSILRVMAITLFVNLVITPFVITPLKKLCSCFVDRKTPLLGAWADDVELPLWIVDFRQLFPEWMQSHSAVQDEMMPGLYGMLRSAHEVNSYLSYDTVHEAKKVLLKELGKFPVELRNRINLIDVRDVDADSINIRPFPMTVQTANAASIGLHASASLVAMNASSTGVGPWPTIRRFFRLARLKNELRHLHYVSLCSEPDMFAHEEVHALLRGPQLGLSKPLCDFLVPRLASDLWSMATERYSARYPLQTVFSEIMVLLLAYFRTTYRERQRRQELEEEAEAEADDIGDGVVVEGTAVSAVEMSGADLEDDDGGLGATTKVASGVESKMILKRLRELCPAIDQRDASDDWRRGSKWTFARQEDPELRHCSVEEFMHKIYDEAESMPGVVSDEQQKHYHAWKRVTPNSVILFLGLCSTLGVALYDLVQGHARQLIAMDSPLFPAMFRFMNGGSLLTMTADVFLVLRTEYTLGLKRGTYRQSLVQKMYVGLWLLLVATMSVFYLPGLALGWFGFIFALPFILYVTLVLAVAPYFVYSRQQLDLVRSRDEMLHLTKTDGVMAIVRPILLCMLISLMVALYLQMPFNIAYDALLRVRGGDPIYTDSSYGVVGAQPQKFDAVDASLSLLLNEYNARTVACWLELLTDQVRYLTYYVLP